MRYATALLAGVAGMVAASAWQSQAPGRAPVGTGPAPGTEAAAPAPFPPAPARPTTRPPAPPAPAAPRDLDGEIAQLGRRPPRYADAWRGTFEAADDLHAFTRDALPGAREGEGAAQYHVYLALEECVAWLGRDPAAAEAMYGRALAHADRWASAELAAVLREHQRCRGFAGMDLAGLLANEAVPPSGNAEYAALWFERAVEAGYAPALASLALRPAEMDRARRLALLARALAAGGPEAPWQLFAQASAEGAPEARHPGALAWLIVACRAGADCREQAAWHRAWTDDRGIPAQRGRSAIEHYWYELPPEGRLQAWALAAGIEARLRAGEFAALPWPRLPGEEP